jgi:hypothetical protein
MGQHGAALGRGRGDGCEIFRAPPSLGRQLEARQRAGRRAASESGRRHYSPRAHVPLTRRLRRAVAVWPEEPGRTPGLRRPALTLLRRRHLLLHGHRAASPGAASLGSATRGAAMRSAACAAPPAPSLRLRSAACAALPPAFAALPAPRRLRRDASRRAAARGAASPGSASHCAVWPVRPCVSALRAAL